MTELSKNAQVPQCDKTAVISCFNIHLGFGFYIVRTQKSDKKFVSERAKSFMVKYFGKYLETNPEKEMINRRMGFEDGYLACLKDLGLKLRYSKNSL